MSREVLPALQFEILEKIIESSIIAIRYYHPKKQLGDIAKDYEETLEALRALEKKSILILNPSLRFGLFSRCGYSVNLEKARQLYNSSRQ